MRQFSPAQEALLNDYSPAIRAALNQLYDRLSEGVEFPDAVWKVTRKTGFSSFEIERLYDAIEAANNR